MNLLIVMQLINVNPCDLRQSEVLYVSATLTIDYLARRLIRLKPISWWLHKAVPKSSRIKENLQFILDHPRRFVKCISPFLSMSLT